MSFRKIDVNAAIANARERDAIEAQAEQFGAALSDVCEFTCNRLSAPNGIQFGVFMNLAAKCSAKTALGRERFLADAGKAWDMAEAERVKAGGSERKESSLLVTQ